MKQKAISVKSRLTSKTDYYKASQKKEKTKSNQLNQLNQSKENKNSFETSFNQCGTN